MKQFKDLTVEEKLDLIEYYLRGGDLVVKGSILNKNNLIFLDEEVYQKDTTKLNSLYKELSSLKEQIAQEESLLGVSPQGDTTLPMQSPSQEDKASEKGSHVAGDVVVAGNTVKERITLDNWKDLGIKAGDKVEVNKDNNFPAGEYLVDNIEQDNYILNDFLFLKRIDKADWYEWIWCNDDTEMYLIRTEEGSL